MYEAQDDAATAIGTISQMGSVAKLLAALCEITTMGFAAVARVTESTWTACAVHDSIQFGMKVGQQLDIHTTLCCEVRGSRSSIVIERASTDPDYCRHPTPKMYGFESYISVPIILANDEYFGNLCALDPQPVLRADSRIELMFHSFAKLIAQQLEQQAARRSSDGSLWNTDVVAGVGRLFVEMLLHDDVAESHAEHARNHPSRLPASPLTPLDSPSCKRDLKALIDDVLQYARNRVRGGIPFDRTEVADLGSELTELVARVRREHRGRTIIANIGPLHTVKCDRAAILRLSRDLLANALAIGAPDGPVGFVVSTDERDLHIEVWNGGAALAPAELGENLSPFRELRSDPRIDRLRLHLCSEIARAHRGRLTFALSEREGSQFIARIPRAPAPPGDQRDQRDQ